MYKTETASFIQRLSKIGIVIPGHIHKKYLTCGRDYCRCMKSKKAQHGPYYFWQYKQDNKVTSKSIPEEKLKEFYRWFNHRKLLEVIINEMLDNGRAYVFGILKKYNENKLKKNSLAKRGM